MNFENMIVESALLETMAENKKESGQTFPIDLWTNTPFPDEKKIDKITSFSGKMQTRDVFGDVREPMISLLDEIKMSIIQDLDDEEAVKKFENMNYDDDILDEIILAAMDSDELNQIQGEIDVPSEEVVTFPEEVIDA